MLLRAALGRVIREGTVVMADDQKQEEVQAKRRRVRVLTAAAVLGIAMAAAVGYVVAGWLCAPPGADPRQGSHVQELFQGWPEKPDLILLLSGEQHGYLDPCGCSKPQVGGLVRRYNFVQSLHARNWPVIGVDLGDIPQRRGPAQLSSWTANSQTYMPNVQGLLKYKYSMEALKRMGYVAVNVGHFETALPEDGLMSALTAFTLQNFDKRTDKPQPPYVLSANLEDRDKHFPEMLSAWKVAGVQGTDLKVGIIGVVGPSVAHVIAEDVKDPHVKFPDGSVAKAVDSALKEMEAEKPDLKVLLYQGKPEEARACVTYFKNTFQVVLCRGRDEPPSNPEVVEEAGTYLVTIGHKGKYVGAMGVQRTGKENPKFKLLYQLVPMDERFLTPEGKEDSQEVMKLLEDYTRELKHDKYLARFLPMRSKHPLQVGVTPEKKPVYVGSEKCRNCHQHAYEIWKNSLHAHAYATLEQAKHPSLRQFDGECIICHTVGFSFEGGFENDQATPHLKNVGCENCHGPASQHVRNPNDVALREALNPWKAKPNETAAQRTARMTRLEVSLCVKCHDSDNDVHWSFEKWQKIVHMTPKDE
jgi:hypothetical protein